MDDPDDASDDRPSGPPPAPEARPWRHPSELAGGWPVRWGLPDAAVCWLAGFAGGAVAAAPVVASRSGGDHAIGVAATFLVILPSQHVATLAALWWVSRTKGVGTWREDFGWEIRRRDAGAVLVGIGLQFLLTLMLVPVARLADRPPDQGLVRLISDNTNLPLSLAIVVATVVVAPLVEELLFRGLLLRSLLRRLEPVAALLASGVAFGLVHLIDPGALVAVPGLAVLGTILSVVAVRTNSLSRPILIHAGFNLTATVLALAT